MIRLLVQLCALDEQECIADVIRSIPRAIPGVDIVTVVVIDDGSTDDTARVAIAAGADKVVRHPHRRGLAQAFQRGLDEALRLGADIVVNIDADGQYRGEDIPSLIRPILAGTAEIVIGDRKPGTLSHFSPAKRSFQALGSAVVRTASGLNVHDAVSGFRAYSREAALRLFVAPLFSYTVQTLVQAGKLGLAVTSVPIDARETTRPSRLQKNMRHFMTQQAVVLARTYVTYEPVKTFLGIAAPFLLVGVILLARVVILGILRNGQFANVPSLIGGTISLLIGLLLCVTAIIGDRIRENRRLLEEILYRLRRAEVPR